MTPSINLKNQRLESLDILRGLDLFCLVALRGLLGRLQRIIDTPWMDSFMWGFNHVEWAGLSPWDLVMPLFMFMSGITIPFALAKYKRGEAPMRYAFKRIVQRVLLLWILGMVCQGNLLGLNPDKIYLYTNTLQAIAVGYLIASLSYLLGNIKVQIGVAISFLLLYWGSMEFISVDGFGGGDYTPNGNLAEWIDRVVLGRFRDGAIVGAGGEIIFKEGYNYTWILSSLTFGVTALTGLFAGTILKSDSSDKRKLIALTGIGFAMVAFGWLWHLQLPVIKKIWTSSMVLVSSGYCFLLMALFYYIIDVRHWTKGLGWLNYYGKNSILAYMLKCVSFSSIGKSLFYGFRPYVGDAWYDFIISLSSVVIVFFILRYLYKRNIFLRV